MAPEVNPLRILVISPPVEDGKTRSDVESRAIKDAIHRVCGDSNAKVSLTLCPAEELHSFHRDVQNANPDILHIAAHAFPFGDLKFAKNSISRSTLIEVLQSAAPNLECLIISACNFNGNSNDYSECCNFLIGCRGELLPASAIQFATEFYEYISRFAIQNQPFRPRTCFQLAQTAVSCVLGKGYMESKSLKILFERKTFANLRDRIEHIERGNHSEKAVAYFDTSVQARCEYTALLAEFGGTVDAILDEHQILPLLSEIRSQAITLSECASKTAPSPEAMTIPGRDGIPHAITPQSVAANNLALIASQIHLLFNTVRDIHELEPVHKVIVEDPDEIDTIRAALLCKLEGARGLSHHVEDFCSGAGMLLQMHESNIQDFPKLVHISKLLLEAILRIIEGIETSIHRRLEGASEALAYFPDAQSLLEGVLLVIGHLPHYGKTNRTGYVLWKAKQ